MPRSLDGNELNVQRADAFVNAGFSHFGQAQTLWFENRANEDAYHFASAAEQSLANALRLVPDHEAATSAVFWLGDLLMSKAHPEEESTTQDMADARDFFGRMAMQFDNADWSNNHAFWCRETGTAASELDVILESLASAGEVLRAGARIWVDADGVGRMQTRLLEELDAFHTAEPLRPGMPRGALRGRLPENVKSEVGELALARLEETRDIEVDGDLVRRAGQVPTLDAEAQAATKRILEEARAAGLDPPSPRDWAKRLGVPPDHFRNLVAHLERDGDLVRAPGDLWFDKAAVEDLRARVVAHLKQQGEIDTAAYKNLTGTSRRTTVPLMELLDEMHVTRRQGDVRILRGG